MSFAPTAFCDCQTIIKSFERGAHYCATQESVFAMLTPILQNNRTNAKAFVEQSDLEYNFAAPRAAKSDVGSNDPPEQRSGEFNNMDKADEDDGGFLEAASGAFSEAKSRFNWQDCVPCSLRFKTFEELAVEAGFKTNIKTFLDAFESVFRNTLQQIEKIKELFQGLDQYSDLCAFLNWLTTYVCLPDLARIVAVLMSLLSRVSFDLGGSVSIIISLVAPLIQPFLSNLVASFQKAILLIVKPLECILDNIQRLLSSADVENAVAQNIEGTQIPVQWRRQGPKIGAVEAPFELSKSNALLNNAYHAAADEDGKLRVDLHSGSRTLGVVDASFGYKEHIDKERARRQKQVEEAQQELDALDRSHKKLNMNDPSIVESYNKRRTAALDKYNEAVEIRDLSKIQRINKRITERRQQVKTMFFKFIAYIQEAVDGIENYLRVLWDELKKLMMEFGGGQSSFIADLIKKMEVLELIQLASALIDLFGQGKLDCDDQESANTGVVLGAFSSESSLNVWTDEEGKVHIEDSGEDIQEAIEEVTQAFGADPENPIKPPGTKSSPVSPLANTKDIRQNDKGNYVTDAKQKLNSLIRLTGDPLLDSDIARATEAVVSRTNVTFKCPLQTSVGNAEKVNKWIRELNQS